MSSSFSSSRLVVWAVWAVASVFYAYQYILRVMPNIMLEDIMRQFNIGAAAFGQFSGVYYIGYSLMHLPIGIMLDRYGPRKIMTGCIFLTVIGTLPLIFTDHWAYPVMGRILIGMGASGAILGVFKVIRMIFSEKKFPRMLSFSVTIGLIGAIYGGGPVSYMCSIWGYQTVLQIFAIAGIALALVTYSIIPDTKSVSKGTVFSNLKEVLGNSRVIWCCICAGLMLGPLEGFADAWGTAFFKQVYGFEGAMAASLPSMIYIGMCFGAPILNLIAEKTRNFLGTIIGAGVIMAVAFTVLLIWHLGPEMLALSFVLVGICCAYQILAIYKASTYVREEVAGLTTAVANMVIMIFGYAFHSIIGGIINVAGGPMVSHAFNLGVAVVPVALCLGVVGFAVLFMRGRAKQKAA